MLFARSLVYLPLLPCIWLSYVMAERWTSRTVNAAQTSSRVNNKFLPLSPIDDDFEAFSSSAYHGLTARVKVTVGIESSAAAGNGNQPPESAVSRGHACAYFPNLMCISCTRPKVPLRRRKRKKTARKNKMAR